MPLFEACSSESKPGLGALPVGRGLLVTAASMGVAKRKGFPGGANAQNSLRWGPVTPEHTEAPGLHTGVGSCVQGN